MNIARLSLNYYPEYVTLKQFTDFLPVKFREDEEEQFKKKNRGDGDIEAFWDNLMKDPSSEASQLYYDNFNKLVGSWLAEQNVIIKINDTVFVHGGLNPEYASKGLEAINSLYRAEFQKSLKHEEFRPRILFVSDAPLWNRDLATPPDTNYVDVVDKILATLNAKRMVVAHTPTIPRSIDTIEIDIKKFGGKVWITDTGIASIYRGYLTALIIDENGRVSVRVY